METATFERDEDHSTQPSNVEEKMVVVGVGARKTSSIDAASRKQLAAKLPISNR